MTTLADALDIFAREIGISSPSARFAVVARMMLGIEQSRASEGWSEPVAVAVECATVARAVREAGGPGAVR